MSHIPVLLKETLELLDPKHGEFFIDGTLGNGGHAEEIIKRVSLDGMFLGIDWDKQAIANCRLQITNQKNVIFVNDNYANLPQILNGYKLPKADGLLLDLGFSSEQLEQSGHAYRQAGRGFSFRRDEPLVMTYSNEEKPVAELLRKISAKDLETVIRNYGEERFAGRIAKAIKSHIPIKTSKQLTDIIVSTVPRNYERGRIHPATRTFQALRIFANHELENLESLLQSISKIIAQNGRVAIISFHSLEDRLVKNYFKNLVKANAGILLNKKPITVSLEEIKQNPRSRSAKLRAIQFL